MRTPITNANNSNQVDFATGAVFISDTATHTGSFRALYFKEETVIAAASANNWSGAPLAAQTFAANTTIHGRFTSIQLTSGSVIAYRL